MDNPITTEYQTVDAFDRLIGSLSGLPGVVHSREATITIATIVESSTFIVQTYRLPELGDTIFLQRVDRNGAVRIAIPPKVAEAIARQRDSLSTQRRRVVGQAQAPRLRQLAAERKAAGIEPAFMKKRKGRK
jgi:hypothetical protein